MPKRFSSLDQMIRSLDPDFDRDRRVQVEYEMSNSRRFVRQRNTGGAYAVDPVADEQLIGDNGGALVDSLGRPIRDA